MLNKILIIANPGSGKGDAPEYAESLRGILQETYQSEVEIRETAAVGDATDWARTAKSAGFDTVVCLGGDGTVNEVVNGLMSVAKPPLFSFVPLGTANDLGRVLGFEMNPDAVLEQFKNMEIDTVDIGQVNDHYFVDVVAIGDIPTAVMGTDSDKKNRLGFLAYLLDGAKAIMDGEIKSFQVSNSKGEIFKFQSNAIVVALTSSVGGMEKLIEHQSYKDGVFQFFALKGDFVASALETLVNEGGIPEGHVDDDTLLAFSDHEVSLRLVVEGETAELATSEEIYANVDGDEGPALPLTITIHPQALKVLKPVVE